MVPGEKHPQTAPSTGPQRSPQPGTIFFPDSSLDSASLWDSGERGLLVSGHDVRSECEMHEFDVCAFFFLMAADRWLGYAISELKSRLSHEVWLSHAEAIRSTVSVRL